MKLAVTKGAGVLTIEEGGGVVLSRKFNRKLFQFQKGGVEKDETAEAAARREALEEGGLQDLVVLQRLKTYDLFHPGEKRIIRMFLCRVSTPHDAYDPQDPAYQEVKVFQPDDVPDALHHDAERQFYMLYKTIIKREAAKVQRLFEKLLASK